MAGDAIPAFRLTETACAATSTLSRWVRLHKDTPVDAAPFDTLAEENDAVYIAVGAGKPASASPAKMPFWIAFLSADAGASPRHGPRRRHRAGIRNGLRPCRQTPVGVTAA
ncbi:MAG: hypothetical protein ACLR7Z_02620 [Bilophila wadsworthia]